MEIPLDFLITNLISLVIVVFATTVASEIISELIGISQRVIGLILAIVGIVYFTMHHFNII